MSQYQCSVVIVQYYPSLEKIKRTLNSILCQKNCSYEIIIADDGSENTYFKEIEKYFQNIQFKDFKLVENKINGGTVKNILSGLAVATGKYVRVIAPGDMLYNNMTLSHIIDFMDKNDAKEIFGKMVCFQETEKNVEFFSKSIPVDIKPYVDDDKEKIKKNLLNYGDNISGASFTWNREYYTECLNRICNKVIYLEDCINLFTIYDGHSIFYLDEYVTWYEYGTGISTKGSDKWTLLIWKDWKAFFQILYSRFSNDLELRRAKKYWDTRKKRGLLGKVIDNILHIDRFIYYKFKGKPDAINEDDIDKESLFEFLKCE